jgi:UDP-glucose 4-epimerase
MTIRILDNMQQGGYQGLMALPEEGRYEFVEGDILDPVTMRRAVAGAEAVVHMAAIVTTPFSFDHPAWTEQVNHWGTTQLVEHCLAAGVSRFIYASSASVYGPGTVLSEKDPCQPVGPYAQSKLRAEQALLTAMERGLRPTVLRLATVFGYAPTMRFDAVANRLAYLGGVGRSLTVYGTGRQIRPLIHVRDASEAIRFCLARATETEGEIFNVVGENASILDLVEAVRQTKPDIRLQYTEQHMMARLSLTMNGDKFEALGWAARYSIEAGMAEVVSRFGSIGELNIGAQDPMADYG